MKELKSPTTYSEQADMLASKGVIIGSRQKAIHFLSRVNYYRVSSYLLTYRNPDGKTYRPVLFDDIIRLYGFDQKLRSIIFKSIEDIEVYLRSAFSYYSAHHHGPEGYIDAKNYNEKHNHDAFMKKVNHCIQDNALSPVVLHHQEKYGGHIPIWAVVDFFSFGTLTFFYSGMPNSEKAELAKALYGANYQRLQSWLHCANGLRNRCAHYGRLYYWKFPSMPMLPKSSTFEPGQKLFTQLYVLMLLHPEPSVWNETLSEIDSLIAAYSDVVQLSCLEFPDDWKAILSKKE